MKNTAEILNTEQNAAEMASIPKTKLKRRFLLISVGGIITLLIILLAYRSIWTNSLLEHGEIVESIQELAVLATAEAHVKTVIEQEDNKIFGKEIPFSIPGTQRHLLLIVPATVIAGVDLKNMNEDQVQFNRDTNEITINLPHASILQEPSITMSEIRAFSTEGLFRSKVDWEEGFELADIAKQQAKEEAVAMGLLANAENNAVKLLQQFFTSAGYTVSIYFQ